MRRRALRPSRATPGVLPPRQAVPQDRNSLRNAVRPGELLLALLLGVGAREHDPRIRRDARLSALSEPRFSHPQRIHGSDDHGQESGGRRDQEVRGHA